MDDPFGTLARIETTKAGAALLHRSYRPAKITRITVDCRTGERTVEHETEVKKPAISRPLPPPRPPIPFLGQLAPSLRPLYFAACEAYGIPPDRLFAPSRLAVLARARFAFYRLARRYTNHSLAALGRMVGRDHTTIIAGLKRAHVLMRNRDWRAKFEHAVRIVEAGK